jgi:hypothetical protein
VCAAENINFPFPPIAITVGHSVAPTTAVMR